MNHWNGNQICAVDIETTGLNPERHEMIQLSMLPLDVFLNPRKDVMPLDMLIKPDYPETIDPEAMTVNRIKMTDITIRGFDREAAKDLFINWLEKLKLPMKKFGSRRCKIYPLGHNYGGFDLRFIVNWFGREHYEEWFDRPIDTMIIGQFLNDRAGWRSETVPYSKVNLNWMCCKHGISNEGAHNSLIDCKRTAELYKALVSGGALFG